MAESMKYRLTLPPGAVAPVDVIRIGDEEIEIPNSILSRDENTLIIAGELSAKTRGLLAEAGVQIEILNGANGTSANGAKDRGTKANGTRRNLDGLFAQLGDEPPDDPAGWDPNDLFAQNSKD